jgi:hypothetical protein
MKRRILAIVALTALTLLAALAGVYVWFFTPDASDWESKMAWKNCQGAIDAYPGKPAPSCGAMSMCANEASLSPADSKKLRDMETAAGCHAP